MYLSPARPGFRVSAFQGWGFLPALLFLPMVLIPPINHDVSVVLQFSQRWLAGERLYTDLIDVNPPLIFILNLLPAAITAYTPVGPVLAVQLCVCAWGLLCWRLAWIARDRAAEGKIERLFLDTLPLLFLLAAGYDFGQREHLMTMAALPYLFAAGRRCGGSQPRGRISIALVAALGFALKPYFLALPALIELAVLVACYRRRRPGSPMAVWLRDPVPWILGTVWGLYLLLIAAVLPAYFTTILPLVREAYLGFASLPWTSMVIVPRFALANALLSLLLLLAFVRPGAGFVQPGGALPRLFGLAGLAGAIAAFVQHKGFSYHILPNEFFTFALAGLMASRWLDRIEAARHAPGGGMIAGMLTGLFAFYVVATGEAPWKQIHYPRSDADQLGQLLAGAAGGGRAYPLSLSILPVFPAFTYAGITSTSRFMDLWPLQSAYFTCPPNGRRYWEPAELGAAEAFVWQAVAADFTARPPAAVVVEETPNIPGCGAWFDFIVYFSRDPAFADVWRQYRLVGRTQRHRVYTRKDDLS